MAISRAQRRHASRYGQGATRREVLGGIDLEVEEGEFVAIVGFSGSRQDDADLGDRRPDQRRTAAA